jgi:N utilization substance protein A
MLETALPSGRRHTVNELRRRARDALVTDAIKSEETMELAADDLADAMEGMDADIGPYFGDQRGSKPWMTWPIWRLMKLTEITLADVDRAKQLIYLRVRRKPPETG